MALSKAILLKHTNWCRFVVLVCGTLVYSKGDEVQNAKAHAEMEAVAAEEGEAAEPSIRMPGLQ